jgi:hypothetical protein
MDLESKFPIVSQIESCSKPPILPLFSALDNLGPNDIIVGRGRKYETNTGNRRFRDIVRSNLNDYMSASTRQDKSILILSLFHTLRDDVGARFVKPAGDGQYEDCDTQDARDKVAHALRDMSAKKKSKRSQSSLMKPIPAISCSSPVLRLVAENEHSNPRPCQGKQLEDDPLARLIDRFVKTIREEDIVDQPWDEPVSLHGLWWTGQKRSLSGCCV